MLELAQIALVRVRTAGGTYRWGTAYAVTANLVLTARHVWRGKDGASPGASAEVRFGDRSAEWIEVSVEWESEPKWDACLLRLAKPLDGHRAPTWGQYDRSEVIEWESCGFPDASTVGLDASLCEMASMRGTLDRGGGAIQGLHELIVRGPAAEAEKWAGVSGAPVFAHDRLVALTRSAPDGFGGSRLWATPVASLLKDEEFRRAVGEPVLLWVPSSVLQPNIESLPSRVTPGTKLKAKHRVVDFFKPARIVEWNMLTAWCDNDEQVDMYLFTGPGGTGKTRLFIEWCEALRAKGWDAGFLPAQTSGQLEDIEALLGRRRRTFVVIDYAESKPHLSKLLARIAAGPVECERIRVAMLARHAGDWWQALKETSQSHRAYLHQQREMRRVTLDEDMRVRAFEQAYRVFAEDGDAQPPARDLRDPLYARMLYIHMAALAAVEGEDIQAAELVPWVLDREQEFWQRLLPDDTCDVDLSEFIGEAKRFMAALTLRGGVASKQEARRLSKRVEGPAKSKFVVRLASLYPGHPSEGAAAYMSGLEPDLLGEALVARVLGDRHVPQDYVERVLKGTDHRAMVAVFTVLGRVAIEQQQLVRPWLERTLVRDVAHRAGAALEAALAVGKVSAFSPLGPLLAEILRRKGNVRIALALAPMLPERTISLRELAVWVYETLLDKLPDCDKKVRAELLNGLGIRYNAVGKRAEALTVTKEAVALYRKLVEEDPEACQPDLLASSLNNLGGRYSDVGQRAEALAVAEEAVEIRRKLVEEEPEAFQPGLAMSLSNLGILYSDVGKRGEAMAVTKEAVELYRKLAEEEPEAFQADLARSLTNLGLGYIVVGKRADAVAVTEEAVELYRKLAEEEPEAFQADLAGSLSNLGADYSAVGKLAEALVVTEEAVEIRRKLAEGKPEAFQPDLVVSLINLGAFYNAVGKRAEALTVTEEAVALYRKLAEEEPEAFQPGLAVSLTNLGCRYSELGKHAEALTAATEAVEIYNQLMRELPRAFADHWHTSVGSLAARLRESDREPESDPTYQAAVEILESLQDPQAEE